MAPSKLPPYNDYAGYLHETVANVVAQLERLGTDRPLERVHTKVYPSQAFGGRIEPRFARGLIRFSVSEGLLIQLYDSLKTNIDDIQLAVLWPVSRSNEQPFISEEGLLGSMYDLTLHLVVLHELSHWLCGHFQVDSHQLASLEGIMGNPDQVFLWVTEIEADNTAVQVLTEAMCFDSVYRSMAELEGFDSPASNVTLIERGGTARVIGFRMLFAALWIVVALIEAGRGETDGYPLPSARLYASISTLMALYAGLDDASYDSDHNLIVQPAESQQEAIMTFLRHVVKPVAEKLAAFPNPEISRRLCLPLGQIADSDEMFIALLQDIQGLMFGGRLSTTGAKQLYALQPTRERIDKILRPHRYLRGMTNGPRA